MADVDESNKSKTTEVKNLVKNASDLQRLKLERLMKNPVSKISTPFIFNLNTK